MLYYKYPMETPFERQNRELAQQIIDYTNTHGMWPTIDFIVKRWVEKNPEYFLMIKGAIADEKSNLQDQWGSNRQSKKGSMEMRRLAEVPDKVYTLVCLLFAVEQEQYKGGKKGFWRDFSKRYPIFNIGDSI